MIDHWLLVLDSLVFAVEGFSFSLLAAAAAYVLIILRRSRYGSCKSSFALIFVALSTEELHCFSCVFIGIILSERWYVSIDVISLLSLAPNDY